MRRLVITLSLFLIAASAGEVATQLEESGYYIEPGANVSEQVVSDAVFAGRSDGGRLYLVVLAEEPPGGAPTFSDSVLDQLVDGYVVTVAPETVGFAGDGSFWSEDEMNAAVDASLEAGGSDDQVIENFIAELTGTGTVPSPDDEQPSPASGANALWVLVVLIGVGALVFFAVRRSSRQRSERAAAELEKVKARAREKLAEIANDIIDMEDEVELSENADVKAHYQRASATYTTALAQVDASKTPTEMVDVVHQLDLAIWELDAAEALLDGKPVPAKPEPPQSAPPPPPQREPGQTSRREEVDESFGRRPGRQSSYAGNDLMTALWAILAMSQRGPGGFGGMPGGFGGPMGGRGGTGGSRMRGGGFRGGGGGRMRGGGRRR